MIYLSVDKLILFGILYATSDVDNAEGNQAKALAFYHLLNNEDLVANVKRSSRRLKLLMHYMFELA